MKSVSGRPIKLTNSILEDILYGIGKGLTLKASCKFAGISYSALAWWMSKGKQAKQIGITNQYTAVWEQIKQATYAEKLKHRKNFLLALNPRDFRYGWKKREA
jgi:hypothetical protein